MLLEEGMHQSVCNTWHWAPLHAIFVITICFQIHLVVVMSGAVRSLIRRYDYLRKKLARDTTNLSNVLSD